MNSKQPSVVEWTDMPLSVSDQYWRLKALYLDQQMRDPSVSERITLVPPRKNDIGLWDLAYVQPKGGQG